MIRTTDLRKLIHEHNGSMCDVYESLMDDYDWIDATICGLDAGWAIAFGAELINDMEIAKKNTYIPPDENDEDHSFDSKFKLIQIKEKFGSLRFYAYGMTEAMSAVVSVYEIIAYHACIKCGNIQNIARTDERMQPICRQCARLEDSKREAANLAPSFTHESFNYTITHESFNYTIYKQSCELKRNYLNDLASYDWNHDLNLHSLIANMK